MSKHTPGDWLIAPSGKTFVYSLNEQGYNRFWAHVQGGNTAPMERTSEEELAANALLISAAPDLLAACQKFMYTVPHAEIRGEPESLLEVMRAAIAKASPSVASVIVGEEK
jgi:hypothetical protein